MANIKTHNIKTFLSKLSLDKFQNNKWFRIITITLLSYILSYSLLYQIISSPIFTQQKGNDFEMSDFYNVVANNRPLRTLNEDIVIVSIDNCSRLEIAQLIDIINYTEPSAIGVDVFFTYISKEDSLIIETFNQTPNLVLAYDAFLETNTYFAPSLPNTTWGAINLTAKHTSGIIRQFQPQFNDSIFAFSAQLVKLTNPKAFNQLKNRNKNLETICYPSQEFEIIDGMSILQGKINLLDLEDILHNKIILLGDTHNPFDQHQTPIASNMPGIIINAHILATIQNNLYIDSTPNWINWCIAVAVGLLLSFMIVTFQTTNVLKSYTSFAIRIFQVLVIIVFLYIGCFIFAQWHYYCNFAPSLFMVGLGVLAVAVEPIVYLLLRTIIATIKYILNHTHNIVIFIIKTYRKTKAKLELIKRKKKETKK